MICTAFLFSHLLNYFGYWGAPRTGDIRLKQSAGFLTLLILGPVLYQCIKWSERRVTSLNTRLSIQQEIQKGLKKNEQEMSDLTSQELTEKGLALIADCRQIILSADSKAKRLEQFCSADTLGILNSPERWTGIPEVNAVIEQEKRLCEKQNIQFETDIILPSAGTVEILDLCIILLNLLDNAVRACSLSENLSPCIRISIAVQGSYLVIVCQNDSNRRIERKIHKTGQGMSILHSMAVKYNGHFSTEKSDGSWHARLILECR